MKKRNILITGGAGFIGSHVVEHFAKKYPNYQIIVIDALTYAANSDLFDKWSKGKYKNVKTWKGDIVNWNDCNNVINVNSIDSIIHLAAESHVDNSIKNPMAFVETNVIGTVNLLNAAKNFWDKSNNDNLFYHISTDEVFGTLESVFDEPFNEGTPYDPRSPYSASKASSDHFVRAYGNTYNFPFVKSNCSNNYGPHQHEEKLLPKAIKNLLTEKKIPIYGKGDNIRDWLYVGDHVDAIDLIFHEGDKGETYCIGGDCEMQNIDLIKILIDIHVQKTVNNINDNVTYLPRLYSDYIEFVEDRKGHDYRYSIDHSELTGMLDWKSKTDIRDGLELTYNYYKNKIK